MESFKVIFESVEKFGAFLGMYENFGVILGVKHFRVMEELPAATN